MKTYLAHEGPSNEKVLETKRIIKSKRRSRYLKTLLTRAKLPSKHKTPLVKKCNRPNCDTCRYLLEGSTFKVKSCQTFTIRKLFSCTSKILIYVFKCGGYDDKYVGQTSITLRDILTVHKQQIRDCTRRKILLR